jgi:predicted O-linked N-acetylglucosamine transferase (SPINDLY family)
MDPTYADALAQIERLAQLGQWEAAENACRELTQRMPQAHEGWAWRGMLALVQGRCAEAESCLREALARYDRDPHIWGNLSLALRFQGRRGEAEEAARRALALSDAADFWSHLGNCLFDQARWDEAAEAYRQALARSGHEAQVWTNLGAALHAAGRQDEAQSAFERSLALRPDDPATLTRAALLALERGRPRDASELAEAALMRQPQLAPAWVVLGNARRLQDDLAGAEAAYRQAVQILPGYRDARYNLALVLLQRLSFCEAEQWVRPLVEENPADAEAWTVLGGALHAQSRIDEALAAFQRSVELKPDPLRHSKWLVALHYSPTIDAWQLGQAHRVWDETYARPLLPPTPPGLARRGGEERLRVGLVGMDFTIGPTGFLALAALERLDRRQCWLACYADRAWEDAFTARFRQAADAWRVVWNLSDEALAEQVRRDEIDVLVDLGGHVGRRLLAFARRPAPRQVTWLGYVGTTGLSAMDGLIADRFHVPPGEEDAYTETVLRMPHDYICYGPPDDAPPVEPLPALERGRWTFGCFNNPAKFHPGLFDLWAQILRRVPDACLLLKYGGLDQPLLQARICQQFAARGVDPARLIFEGWSEHRQLLARYGQVDLALDTQPYSGGLTTCEALWMGVPVVTFPGRTFASRHATSHLHHAGLSIFVASSPQEYVDLAVSWSQRPDALAALRAGLREQVRRSPLCDAATFARDWLELMRRTLALERDGGGGSSRPDRAG